MVEISLNNLYDKLENASRKFPTFNLCGHLNVYMQSGGAYKFQSPRQAIDSNYVPSSQLRIKHYSLCVNNQESTFLHKMVLVYEVMNILLDCQCWNDQAQTNDDRLKWIPKRKLGSIMKGYTKQRPGNLAFWDETNAFGHKRWLSLESPPMILTEVQWNGNMRGNEGIELLDFQNKRK